MRIVLVFFAILIAACSDSPRATGSNIEKSEDSERTEIDLPDIREDYERLYKQPFIIDTVFFWRETAYNLYFQHYATMDSGINVPAKYNFDINRAFLTHNFESKLIISRDSDTILNRKITKQNFKNYLTPELVSCGTLLYPNLHIQADTIILHYSLAIPVTDIGIAVEFGFIMNGDTFIDSDDQFETSTTNVQKDLKVDTPVDIESSAIPKWVMDTLRKLPETKSLEETLRNTKRKNKNVLFFGYLRKDRPGLNYYYVQVGEDNDFAFVSHFTLLIYPVTKRILYYDILNDTLIQLDTWRMNRKLKL